VKNDDLWRQREREVRGSSPAIVALITKMMRNMMRKMMVIMMKTFFESEDDD